MIQLFSSNSIAKQLNTFILQGFYIITQSFNNLIAYRQSNCIITRIEIFIKSVIGLP